jgi:hypothetical protein
MRFSMLTRSGFRRTSYSCCSSTSVVGGIQRWICKSLVFNAHGTEHEVMPRMSRFFQKLKAEAGLSLRRKGHGAWHSAIVSEKLQARTRMPGCVCNLLRNRDL